MMPRREKIAKVTRHGILVVRDKNAALEAVNRSTSRSGTPSNRAARALWKSDGRFAAKDTGTDSAAEIVVGLEPGLH